MRTHDKHMDVFVMGNNAVIRLYDPSRRIIDIFRLHITYAVVSCSTPENRVSKPFSHIFEFRFSSVCVDSVQSRTRALPFRDEPRHKYSQLVLTRVW